MSLAKAKWFDYSTYMNNKLAQMQESDPSYTMDDLVAAFNKYGFSDEAGAYKHFQKYGHKEDVSPNATFDPTYYYQSKAIQYYTGDEGGHMSKDDVLANITLYAAQMKAAIAKAGMDAWTHFIKWGTAEGVNPSANFNTSEYMQDKFTAWSATTEGSGKNIEDMYKIFKSANLNALEHAIQYGTDPTTATAGEAQCWTDTSHTTLAEEYASNDDGIGGGTGETFALTTGIDTKVLGATDDTFIAGEISGSKTLTAGDDLDGGKGDDTINVSTSKITDYSGFTMKNVETLQVTADGGNATFDLSGTTGLETVRSSNSNSAATFNHLTSLVDVEAVNLTPSGTTSPDITVQFENSVVKGTEDAVNVTVNNSNVGTLKVGSVSDDNAGIEVLNLTALGGATKISAIDSDITTLNFTGDQNVEISTSLNKSVQKIDASTATGGLKVTVGGYGDNSVSFQGGSGDDEINFGTTLDVKDVVKGGEGTDRVAATQSSLIAAAGKISEVEIIRVNDALTVTGTTLEGKKFADATTFEVAGGLNGDATIKELLAT
ncbi:MAG: hypothetical protein K5657_04385, partial [Desulfovibrio sp.]|nr:hypothetical protein [Desulfovibrio sp.]